MVKRGRNRKQEDFSFTELRSGYWRRRSSLWAMLKYAAILVLVIWIIYMLRGIY